MTSPFNGRDLATLDPVTHRLPALTEQTLPAVLGKGVAGGVAALDGNGKVLSGDGSTVPDAAALTALAARIDQTPYELETVGGVYPPRPNTPQHVHFLDPAVQPSFDGQLTGGGGMVPDWDVWWTGGSGVATA